jgi:hypothetical protein
MALSQTTGMSAYNSQTGKALRQSLAFKAGLKTLTKILKKFVLVQCIALDELC